MDLDPTVAASRERCDVVVVGAGVSGLAAARALVGHGLSVVVLESRNRVGGRLSSHITPDGDALDLGATWFWPNEARVRRLVDELRVPTHDHYLGGDALFHQPGGSDRIDGNPIDVESGRFSGGAQSLATALVEGLPAETVRLETTVCRIVIDGAVRVEHDSGSVGATHVVLALPPALAVHRIEFVPELPHALAGLAASTPVWMGAFAKVVVRFDRAFWRDRGLSGSAMSHLGPMREIHDMSGPDGTPAALFGFVPLTSADGPPTESAVGSQLAELFGPDAPLPVEIAIHDWSDDPDTSPPGVERLSNYQTYGHPRFQEPAMDGRLHWGSTETSTTAPGHIEGALAAAERVVGAVLAHPSTPSANESNQGATQ